MGRRKQEGEPEPAGADIAPMDAAELEEIGERLFGRVGWTVKIARLVGKDSSTLRRWRAGSPIEPVYAKVIRDYDRDHSAPGEPSWDDRTGRRDAEALRALRLVARAQALSSVGAPVGVLVAEEPEGLAVTLRVAGMPPATARQDGQGLFVGIDGAEEALERAWSLFAPEQGRD